MNVICMSARGDQQGLWHLMCASHLTSASVFSLSWSSQQHSEVYVITHILQLIQSRKLRKQSSRQSLHVNNLGRAILGQWFRKQKGTDVGNKGNQIPGSASLSSYKFGRNRSKQAAQSQTASQKQENHPLCIFGEFICSDESYMDN